MDVDSGNTIGITETNSIIDPAIFEHVQSQIDEDTQVREVSNYRHELSYSSHHLYIILAI